MERKLFDITNAMKQKIERMINKEKEEYILNVGEESYVEHMLSEYKIDPLVLYSKDAYADSKEENISGEYFPRGLFNVDTNKSYHKVTYYFHIPYEGEKDLFYCQASRYTFNPPRADVSKNEVIFRFIDFYGDIEKINKEYTNSLKNLTEHITYVNNDVIKFNGELEYLVRNVFTERKVEILKRRDMQTSLIVPIKKKNAVSETFSIPSPKIKKKIRLKPVQSIESFNPEPTLDETTYYDILRLINDMGKEFERKPSVYADKGEEGLRDHFLTLLEPHFEGSATGETFNKTGKTDILLKYNGGNVFIGECKFWRGEKSFLNTIDQLLGYLTWRDSKTAVIMFVDNKNFTEILNKAKSVISQHSNYIRFEKQKDETWNNYIFHLNDDKNKEIKVATMFYHVPK